METFDVEGGHSNAAFSSAASNPPFNPDYESSQDQPQGRDYILPPLGFEEVWEATMQYVNKHCCYGKKFMHQMHMEKILMMSTFHYVLETFGETRQTSVEYVPYWGQTLDGPENGRSPTPWEISAVPSEYFKDSERKIEIPHTAFLKTCHRCDGDGYVTCSSCSGSGRETCWKCSGSGRVTDYSSDDNHEEPCDYCTASGYTSCTSCDSSGRKECRLCSGHGKLKGYTELTIIWKTHKDDFITETSEMPKERVRTVQGRLVFSEQAQTVRPISENLDPKVNEGSRLLMRKHKRAFPLEKIIKQRHVLLVVPVTQVEYTWKNKTGKFYVYGFENKVYFEKYPQSCCCGCVVI